MIFTIIFQIFELPKGNLSGIYEPKYLLEPPHYDGVTCLQTINNYLFSGSRDQHLVKWDLRTNRRCQQLTNAHRQWILSLSSLPGTNNDSILVSSCREGFIKLWDANSCSNLGEVRGHNSAINCLARNSTCLFTASKYFFYIFYSFFLYISVESFLHFLKFVFYVLKIFFVQRHQRRRLESQKRFFGNERYFLRNAFLFLSFLCCVFKKS